MSAGDIRTARQAREVLGLGVEAGPDEVRRAFRRAVREAHPDRGGDAERLRAVIDAHRVLTSLQESLKHETRLNWPPTVRPVEKPDVGRPLPLPITVTEAVLGAAKRVRLPDNRQGRLKLPPGLRAGDTVRLTLGERVVLFAVELPKDAVRGDDLWITAAVPAQLARDGGPLLIDTPRGPQTVRLTPDAAQAGVLRVFGQGLPARGAHPQGHLYVQLKVAAEAPPQTARDKLARFAASWAA